MKRRESTSTAPRAPGSARSARGMVCVPRRVRMPMRPLNVSLGVAHLAVTAGLFCFAGFAAADEIELVSGSPRKNVKIVRATYEEIEYTLSGAGKSTQKEPAERVLSITRATSSNDLRAGRAALERADYDTAIRRLEAIAKAAADWERAEAAYLVGRALAAKGERKKAAAQLQQFVEEFGPAKDWWVPHALNDLGDIQIRGKRAASAKKSFARLGKLGGRWESAATVGAARVAIAERDKDGYRGVQEKLGSILRSRNAPRQLKEEAALLRAEIFLLRSQGDRALEELGRIFFDATASSEAGYSARRAAAYLLAGKAEASKGGTGNLQKAEIHFLKVAALFRNQGEVYRDACSELAKIYTQLKQPKRADHWKKRAKE